MAHKQMACKYGQITHFEIQVPLLKLDTMVRVEPDKPNLVEWIETKVDHRDLATKTMKFHSKPMKKGESSAKLEVELEKFLEANGVVETAATAEAKLVIKELMAVIHKHRTGDGTITVTTMNGGTDDPNPAQYYVTYS